MKVLCVCDAGNVRSHALKIACQPDHEALAIGRWFFSGETIDMLSEWADVIIVAEPDIENAIDARFHEKMWCVDLGPDVWGSGLDAGLKGMARDGVAEVMRSFALD
jgi:hypothetical protein